MSILDEAVGQAPAPTIDEQLQNIDEHLQNLVRKESTEQPVRQTPPLDDGQSLVRSLPPLSVSQRPRLRGQERFPIGRHGSLAVKEQTQSCKVIDMSLTGALIGGAANLAVGQPVRLSLDELSALPATVVRKLGNNVGIRFTDLAKAEKDKLIVYLYTSGLCNQVQEINPFQVLWRLLTRAFLDPA